MLATIQLGIFFRFRPFIKKNMKTVTHKIIILQAGLLRAVSGSGEKMFLVLP
jgi:hypothetical protein